MFRAALVVTMGWVTGGSLHAAGDSAGASAAGGGSWAAAKSQYLNALASGDDGEILDALAEVAKFDSVDVAKLLIKGTLTHEDFIVHRETFGILSRLKDEDARKEVIETAAEAREWELRATCVRVMASYSGRFVYSRLVKALEDKKWQVRSSAIRALAFVRYKEAIPLLIDTLQEERGRLLEDLGWTLQRLTGMEISPRYQDWKNWWDHQEEGYRLPSRDEAMAKLQRVDAESKDLHTAVAEGLYGQIYSEKIAFLLDCSGSMTVGTDLQGTRAEISRSELVKVLENQLSNKTYFNIIAFAEGVYPLRKGLIKASSSHIKKAKGFIEKLQAGGETNAYGALEAAFEDPDVDTIYLLSDGVPTVGEETIPDIILFKIANWNRDRRLIINCIGFFPGEAKNQDKIEARDFLRRLAQENDGVYTEVQ